MPVRVRELAFQLARDGFDLLADIATSCAPPQSPHLGRLRASFRSAPFSASIFTGW